MAKYGKKIKAFAVANKRKDGGIPTLEALLPIYWLKEVAEERNQKDLDGTGEVRKVEIKILGKA